MKNSSVALRPPPGELTGALWCQVFIKSNPLPPLCPLKDKTKTPAASQVRYCETRPSLGLLLGFTGLHQHSRATDLISYD